MYLHPSTLDLHLQASTPSSQLWSNFLLPAPPPQFLYQAPPGAQQLARPDVLNIPQFEHIVTGAMTPSVTSVSDLTLGVLATRHRASDR